MREILIPKRRSIRSRLAGIGAAAIALSAFAAGCGSDSPTVEPLTPVAVTPSKTSVTLVRSGAVPNPTTQLSATVSGTDNTAVTYTSTVPGVATVSATGLVTAQADGSTSILIKSVSDPTKNASVVVNVVSTIVATSPGTIYLPIGYGSRTVTATVTNNTNTAVTWSSSNTAIATVSSTGVVTPVATGTAMVTATSVGDPSKSASTTVVVDPAPPVGAIALTSGTSVNVSGAQGTQQLYYIVVPAGKTSLKIDIAPLAGTIGDVDFYVQKGRPIDFNIDTSVSSWACYSWNAGNTETCTVTNPQQRIYYITLDAYETYNNAKLTATLTP